MSTQFVIGLTRGQIEEALRLYATKQGREVPEGGNVTLSGLYGGMPGDDVLLRMTIDVPNREKYVIRGPHWSQEPE